MVNLLSERSFTQTYNMNLLSERALVTMLRYDGALKG